MPRNKIDISARLEIILNLEFKTQKAFADKLGVSKSQVNYYKKNPESHRVVGFIKDLGYSVDWYLYGIGDMLISKEVKSNAEVIEGINVDLIDVEKLTIEQIRFIHQKIQPYIEAYNENNLRKHRENEARKELSK